MRPNILLIVADDLGWSDLGAFGGEIDTPNLDAIALRGVRFTNFHTAPVCAPTRAMLMTGADHHEVGLGVMHETITPRHRGRPGHEGHLNARAHTIATRLRDGGYRTLMAGKWHLGRDENDSPRGQGFERSFALLGGEHNHFGADQTEATAGTHGPSLYRADGQWVKYPEGAYSTDYFADRLIEYLEAGRSDPRPFFAYLAFTAPHSPLQAPQNLIAKYRGRYDSGPEALRTARLQRMQAMALPIAHARPARTWAGPPWHELTAQTRTEQARRMEVYAAMVEALDAAVGRVVTTIARMGRLEDTAIVFLSDNGPAGVARETLSPWKEMIAARADNSLDNIGKVTSYTSNGPSWAEAQAAPFSLFKRFTTEGGVRTCSFAAGPGIAGGRASDALLHVMDYAATICALAGVPTDAPAGKAPMRGRPAVALLTGASTSVHPDDDVLGWEFLYGRGVRKGPWKAVFLPQYAHIVSPELPHNQWLLYNVHDDPGETIDLAAQHPGKLREMIDAWDRYARETGVVLPEDKA